MPVAVACPKCQKKYSLPDSLLGKSVKCTACAAQFKVPAQKVAAAAGAVKGNTAAAKATNAANAARSAAQQRARALAEKNAEELKRLGVEGLIQRAPDEFAGTMPMQGTPDPLANHVMEDPGFGDLAAAIKSVEAAAKPDDPLAAMFANPALENTKKKKAVTGKPKRQLGPWNSQPWFLVLAIFIPLFLVSIGLSWYGLLPEGINKIVGSVIYGIFSLIGLVIGIWGLKLVYETTPGALQVLLCLFIPFYIIYYVIIHWEPMKPFVFAVLAIIAVTPFSVAALMLSGAAAGF